MHASFCQEFDLIWEMIRQEKGTNKKDKNTNF